MNTKTELVRDKLSIEIPPSLLDEIEYLFIGDDCSEWHPNKVTYRFKDGPLECPFYPGFYYIPGYSRYVINLNGNVITVKTAKQRKWTLLPPAKNSIRGGYVAMPIIADSGVKCSLSRHRAICLTFKSYDKHPSNFIVNHKNGIGGDDRIDNLEFCTYSQNTKHAYDLGLHANRLAPIDVVNWITGYEKSFPSIQSCSDELSLAHTFISNRLGGGNANRYEDGWRFKRASEQWLALNEKTGSQMQGRDVIARRIEDNKQLVFGSISQAANITGISSGTILSHCSGKVQTPMNGWNFRFLEDFAHWPDYTEQELMIFKEYPISPGDGVEVHDLETNQILFFTSPAKAAEHFGISYITVSKLARYNGTRQKRYKFRLVRVRKQF
jgi:hypothetical protein